MALVRRVSARGCKQSIFCARFYPWPGADAGDAAPIHMLPPPASRRSQATANYPPSHIVCCTTYVILTVLRTLNCPFILLCRLIKIFFFLILIIIFFRRHNPKCYALTLSKSLAHFQLESIR